MTTLRAPWELGPHTYPEPAEIFIIFDGLLDYIARKGLTNEAVHIPVPADVAALAITLLELLLGQRVHMKEGERCLGFWLTVRTES